VNAPRRFSQAIAEGDGISLIADVGSPAAAAQAAADGAEALLVSGDYELGPIRGAVSLPILFFWDGDRLEELAEADACVISVPDWQGGNRFGDALEHAHLNLADDFEVAFRIADDEQLAESLERYDPEIFILAAPNLDAEEALEHILDLLPDVPAGKLAIAELPSSDAGDVAALERAGVDGVIVPAALVATLAPDEAPEV
jgi:hypothetical protein